MPAVRIPVPLRELTGGERLVTVAGDNAGAVLDNLFEAYPGLADEVLDDGELKTSTYESINLLIGREDYRELQGRDTPVDDDSTLMLLRTWPAAISGGKQWNRPVGEPPPD